MNIRSILAVTDFSPAGGRAVERAAQIAVAHGAELRLLHLPPHAGAPPADAPRRLTHTARELRLRLAIAASAAGSSAASVSEVAAAAGSADLLVLAPQRVHWLADPLFGSAPARLSRLCRCPVLAVQLPVRRHYARILAAIDFTPASRQLAGLAWRFDEEAEVELFHALGGPSEARLRAAEVSERAIRAYQQDSLRHARHRMLGLADSFDTRRNRVFSAIGRGDPARQAVVQQEFVGADLLMVGRRRNAPIADFLFGSVARRVLERAACDVLIVPDDYRQASRNAARQRIAADRADARGAWTAVRGTSSS